VRCSRRGTVHYYLNTHFTMEHNSSLWFTVFHDRSRQFTMGHSDQAAYSCVSAFCPIQTVIDTIGGQAGFLRDCVCVPTKEYEVGNGCPPTEQLLLQKDLIIYNVRFTAVAVKTILLVENDGPNLHVVGSSLS
jgi:hypothetical protein